MWRMVTRGLVLGIILVSFVSSASAQPAFDAFLEKPQAGETVSGMVLVQGWALDEVGISRIDLIVDGMFLHSADLNTPRADVIAAHPQWGGIQAKRPGFQTSFSASRFSNGAHVLLVRVYTEDNRIYEVGERTVMIDNSINQPPFGFVETPDSTSTIYDVNGSFPVTGWAADVDGVAHVDIQIDGFNVQTAVYGEPRADVANAFPDLPSAMFSGFIAQVDSTRFLDGVHTLVVKAVDRKGLTRTLGTRTIQIFNSENNLRPFGSLDEPQRDRTLYGTCDSQNPPPISPLPPQDDANIITPVRGWALDLGTRESEGRVAYAELMVDGVIWYTTDNCRYNAAFGGYFDCYGLPRPDVAKYYPTHPDSPRSGFFFAMDVGTLFKDGLREGPHTLKVRIGDLEQTFADLPNSSGVPVFFACARNQFGPIGYIDFPRNYDSTKGTILIQGWAFASVANVEVSIDGVVAGWAQYGYPRPDVKAQYPNCPQDANVGWRFYYDTTQLGDGKHRVTVTLLDASGNRSMLGSVDFFTDNPLP